MEIEEARRRQRRLRRSRLEMQSYLAILILVAGASWTYLSSDYLQQPPTFWPTATVAAGAIWYLVVRVYGIITRNR
ncbi:MAG: hypothetical protein AAGA23_10320 [Pseudomonadota bacterium]